MAVYTHFKAYPPTNGWAETMGDTYTVVADLVATFNNTDGTRTRADGIFTVLANGTILGGQIFSLQRTSADGATVYESITGLNLNANTFVAAAGAQKLAIALAGNDSLNGNAGEDFLKGYGGADVLAGGADDDH